jgi:hypothetical protein
MMAKKSKFGQKFKKKLKKKSGFLHPETTTFKFYKTLCFAHFLLFLATFN